MDEWECCGKESKSGQDIGGTQERLLTVAAFQPWRGSKSPAAPGLPGQAVRILELAPGVNSRYFFCSAFLQLFTLSLLQSTLPGTVI